MIAFDFGEKRIGSAVGDLALRIAHPLTTVEAEDNRSRFAAIAKLIDEWRPVVLVVGVPVPSDPGEHEIARLARRFARRLEGRFGIRTDLIDERLSSHAAEASLREQGVRGRRMKNVVDAAAAQQILQSYFETLRVRVSSAAHRP
ncbi:MAG TPA: Holliday junction resolvase RuvX [Burkholderiales bacterium]|nr:Holliday junction resolvase RuvX [Burkholderiales bacterium]